MEQECSPTTFTNNPNGSTSVFTFQFPECSHPLTFLTKIWKEILNVIFEVNQQFGALNMEAAGYFEMLTSIYQTT